MRYLNNLSMSKGQEKVEIVMYCIRVYSYMYVDFVMTGDCTTTGTDVRELQ